MNLRIIQFLIIPFCIVQIFASTENIPKVKTSYGSIKGFYSVSFSNRGYKAFTGIPYAIPPTEHRRFEPPEPINPWHGELDATKTSKVCLQFDYLTKSVIGEEDCLYLNIYVPLVKNASSLPVIFYIHGGAFQYGTSSQHGPKYLMDKNLILVTINYRVGALGLLSTGDEVVPGNMALKDQSLALRWVSENIEHFGGDPKRITLTGCSAGGVSVHYHYFSSMSRGLFQNAISMSGNALVPWALAKDPMSDTKKFAKILNCPTETSIEIINCLKNVPASELGQASYTLLMSEYFSIGIDRPPFIPVVEKIEKGYFINRTPEEIIERREIYDAPWVAGVVSEEGIIFTHGFALNKTSLTFIDENWETVAPYLLFLQDKVQKSEYSKIVKLARYHYFGNESFEVNNSTFRKLIYLTGDKGIAFDTQRAAVLQAKVNKSPVQVYYYNYRAAQSLSNALLRTKKDYGVCHADDSLLILENKIVDPTTKLEDQLVLQQLLNMWYSLADQGQADIGIEWPKVDPLNENLQYLHIKDSNSLTIATNDDFAEKKFWSSIGF